MATRTCTISADGIQEREVVFVKYEFSQHTDVEGQPTGTTRGGKIQVKVKSKDDGNTDILEWMCDTYMSKSGKISFPDRKGSEMKQLTFKEVYVVEYAETYDSSKMQDEKEIHQFEEFTITCKEIQVGHARHNNRWTVDNE